MIKIQTHIKAIVSKLLAVLMLCLCAAGCQAPAANSNAAGTTAAGSTTAGSPAPKSGSARSVADQAKKDAQEP